MQKEFRIIHSKFITMFPNRFTVIVFIRVVLISFTCLAFSTLLTQSQKPATTLFVFMVLVYLTGSLFWYVSRTNRELANFLISLKENETSVAFSEEKLEKTFKGLNHAFKNVKAHFHRQGLENETKQQFLKAVVAQSGGGLICFDKDGQTEIFNHAAEELLGISSITNIKKLNSIYSRMGDKFLYMKPGEQLLIKLTGKTGDMQLSVRAAGIKLQSNMYTIISIQNIHEVLEDTEIESWKKLIRVFTHEIMNSITPITTLTTAMKRRFLTEGRRKEPEELVKADIEDIFECTDIIEERSHGLISFVERYKSLTRLPDAKFSTFSASELIQRVEKLFCEKYTALAIDFQTSVIPENLKMYADLSLIEHVLINLINNSLDALSDKRGGRIVLEVLKKDNKTCIHIKDNGCGIPDDIKDNIFMPFFSGKEGGSGIGLSISKQIIRMHKGKLYGVTNPDNETVFNIELPGD